MARDRDVEVFYKTFNNPHGSIPADELYFDGTYWQLGDREQTRDTRVRLHGAKLSNTIGQLTLQEFEDYVSLDWLTQHGSIETTFKHAHKLIAEERLEFLKENVHPNAWHQSEGLDKIEPEVLTKILSEMGDMWWYATALGIATRVRLADCWNETLRRDWRFRGVLDDQPTLSSVHDVIQSGFVPRLGVSQPGDIETDMSLFSTGLVTNSAIGYLVQINDEDGVDSVSLARVQQNARLGLGHMTGLVALYASKLGGSIADVAEINMRKTQLRAERKNLENKETRQSDEL